MCANRSQIVDEITATAGTSHCTCYKILMTWTCLLLPSTVFHASWHNQCDNRTSICNDLTDNADKDVTFLNQIITGEETWCFLHDP
jgi:hypothetical protein